MVSLNSVRYVEVCQARPLFQDFPMLFQLALLVGAFSGYPL